MSFDTDFDCRPLITISASHYGEYVDRDGWEGKFAPAAYTIEGCSDCRGLVQGFGWVKQVSTLLPFALNRALSIEQNIAQSEAVQIDAMISNKAVIEYLGYARVWMTERVSARSVTPEGMQEWITLSQNVDQGKILISFPKRWRLFPSVRSATKQLAKQVAATSGQSPGLVYELERLIEFQQPHD